MTSFIDAVSERFAEEGANAERAALKAKWQQAFFALIEARRRKASKLAALERCAVWTMLLVGSCLFWANVCGACR